MIDTSRPLAYARGSELGRRSLATYIAIAACAWFLLAGQLFVPLLGVEADEALFAGAFYQPHGAITLRLFHKQVPVMLMSYLGALKAWIYRPMFNWFRPGVWSLREPMLLVGALSIWVFFLLLRRTSGERAAVIGCTLLAVDAQYLLTTVYDWGPVALQHLFLATAAYLLVRFYQQGSQRALAGAAFLVGLALWDKAIATWMISGAAIAMLAFYPGRVRALLTRRRIAICAAGFLLGALPLVLYNRRNHWETFHGNFKLDREPYPTKTHTILLTLDGSGLLGFFAAEDWQPPAPRRPEGHVQALSTKLAGLTGNPHHSLLLYAFALAILLAPFAGPDSRRAILFCLVAMIVAWIQMAITQNAGATVHHTILLWPLPQAIVAISFAAASRRVGKIGRPLLATVTAAILLSGLLLTNQYYAQMIRNGPAALAWSEAIFPLNRYVMGFPRTAVICMDWGILEGLRYLSRGKLFLYADVDSDSFDFANPDFLYIAHTKGAQNFPTNDTFLAKAAAAGFRPNVVNTVYDNFGRAIFQVYRLAPASQQAELPSRPKP